MSKKIYTRRDLIKQFGVAAFLLHPIMRSMSQAAGLDLKKAPRFVSVFKGGGFVPDSFFPTSIDALQGRVIEPLQALSKDLVLFKRLSMGNGDYGDEEGRHYGDEHGGGMNICFTGGRVYGFNPNSGDSYYWGTYDMSVDQRIAQHYKTLPDLNHLAFDSLQIGIGVNSIDKGQIFMSHKQGARGQAPQANGLASIQDPADLYTKIMGRIMTMCQQQSNQPKTDDVLKQKLLNRKVSLLDFQLEKIRDAKRKLGLDTEHSQKLDALLANLEETEKQTRTELQSIQNGGLPGGGSSKACPTLAKPGKLTDSQLGQLNLDQIKSRYDTMTQLVKLSFEWDLTRVVSYMFTTGSNEMTFPSTGAADRHHVYAHAHDTKNLDRMDRFHAEKFRDLLTAIKSIDDNGTSGLYNSTVLMGMDTWNGPIGGRIVDHSKSNMPFILAGQGGGRLQTGRIVDAAGRAHNDLLISALQASGIQTETFGKAQYCKGALI
jgi:Protein of unknown function (DUF1552)